MSALPEFDEANRLAAQASDLPEWYDEPGPRLVAHAAPIATALREGAGFVTADSAASAAAGRTFGFTRLGDMAPIQPTPWLIKPFLEANSLTVLFGDPAVGKSFVAIDMACSVVTGLPWHGKRVRHGAVFYIAGEGLNNIRKRFRAWELHHGIELDTAPLYISNHAVELYSLDEAAKVSETIKQLADVSNVTPALIVIDTLARNFGGDENSTQDMSAFINAVDGALKHAFQACVLIIHHMGHGDKTRARGSIALKGGVDAEYILTKDETNLVRLEAQKMKDGALPEPMAFTSRVVELGLTDEDGDQVTSVVLESDTYVAPPKTGAAGRGKHQMTFLRVLKRLEADPENESGVHETDLRTAIAAEGIDRKRWSEVKKSLLDEGLVRVLEGGRICSN